MNLSSIISTKNNPPNDHLIIPVTAETTGGESNECEEAEGRCRCSSTMMGAACCLIPDCLYLISRATAPPLPVVLVSLPPPPSGPLSPGCSAVTLTHRDIPGNRSKGRKGEATRLSGAQPQQIVEGERFSHSSASWLCWLCCCCCSL